MSEVILESKLDQVQPNLARKVIKQLDIESRWLQRYIREQHMTGPTSESAVSARSGTLRASVMALKAEIQGESIRAGVSMGGPTPSGAYVRVHVGPRGQMTSIVPRYSNWLTIPLAAAKTAAGVAKSAYALKGPWGDTFVRRSKAGNLIVFGKLAYTKGARAGQTHGEIVPLFVLKKMVRIPARIHPEEIIDAFSLKVQGDLQAIGINMTGA
jgi:hypothetical protein